MTVKLVVLYPHPEDPEAFERHYTGEHLPLMRNLVGPDVPLPTYRSIPLGDRAPAYYRMAEIHFRDAGHLNEFLGDADKVKAGLESSLAVSTGGTPVTFICEEQPEI